MVIHQTPRGRTWLLRTLVGGCGAVLVFCIAALVMCLDANHYRHRGPARAPEVSTCVRGVLPSRATTGVEARAPEVGRWSRHSIDMTMTMALRADQQGPDERRMQSLAYRVSAVLRTQVLSLTEDAAHLGLRVEALAVSDRAGRADAMRAVPGVPVEFEVRTSMTGRIEGTGFASSASSEQRNLLRALACAMQVVLPEKGVARWFGPEMDTLGETTASYEILSLGETTRIHRTRKYVTMWDIVGTGVRTPMPTPDSVDEADIAYLPGAGLVESISGRNRIEQRNPELSATSEMVLTTAVRLLEYGASEPPAWPALSSRQGLALEAPGGDLAAALESRPMGFDELLARLDPGLASQRPGMALYDLADLFRRDASAVRHAQELLLRSTLSPGHALRVLDAMALAGTAQTQAVLLSIAEDRGPLTQIRVGAVLGVVRAPVPAPGLLERLCLLLQDAQARSETGLMEHTIASLGTLARNAASAGQAEVAARAVLRIRDEWQGSEDPATRHACILALANARDPSTVSLLVEQARRGDPRLRVPAMLALSEIPSDAATRSLGDIALRDRNPESRSAALSVLRSGNGSERESIAEESLLSDPDPVVRCQAARLLAEGEEFSAEHRRELLERVGSSDASPSVREEAARSLAALK